MADEDLWIGAASQYLAGDDWRTNFESFVESHLYKFAREGREGDDYEHRQHEVWCAFRSMTEQSLESALSSVGGSGAALLAACEKRLDDRNVQRLLHQLDHFDSFFEFTELMVSKHHQKERKQSVGQRKQVVTARMKTPCDKPRATWWTQRTHLIFDGLTLTKASKNVDEDVSGRPILRYITTAHPLKCKPRRLTCRWR